MFKVFLLEHFVFCWFHIAPTIFTLLVACMRLYTPLCLYVRRSVTLLLINIVCFFEKHFKLRVYLVILSQKLWKSRPRLIGVNRKTKMEAVYSSYSYVLNWVAFTFFIIFYERGGASVISMKCFVAADESTFGDDQQRSRSVRTKLTTQRTPHRLACCLNANNFVFYLLCNILK